MSEQKLKMNIILPVEEAGHDIKKHLKQILIILNCHWYGAFEDLDDMYREIADYCSKWFDKL